MQLGLYLPGPSRALSGVQSLRILEGYELAPSPFPVSSTAVHRQRQLEKLGEAGVRSMVTESHPSNDLSELLEVRLLARQQRATFEEGDYTLKKVTPVSDHQHNRRVTLAVRLDVAASEPFSNQLEHLSPISVLADMELGDELKTETTTRITLHRNREASFSVYVACDVTVQPFLLIVRTRHVVTIVNAWSDATMSSAGFSEFPAYGRIYRQRCPLSRDVLNPARVPL